ncbi:MAG TPA: glutaminyl-peptide cyclotransferase [Pseudonocardiaceae bacterium]
MIAVVGLVVALVCALASCSATSSGTTGTRAQRASYQVLANYPHDAAAFTQGLVWVDGQLYESTGLRGASTLRQVDLSSGKVVQSHQLVESDFGEGLTAVGDQLVQLTWKGHHGYVYDRTSLAPIGRFAYPAEGWGLTYDGQALITSDGSATLRFMDPISYQQTRTLTVTMDGKPLTQLNELEYIRGQIWANVWHRDIIVCIDPRTGIVTSYLDLTGILPPGQIHPISTIGDHPVDSRYAQEFTKEAVLNGIAYDPTTDRIFVTGKFWPTLFALRIATGR